MTSQVKGVINHNFPVEVVLIQDDGTKQVIHQAKPTDTNGQFGIDLWFHGNQQVVIKEYKPE